MSDAPRARRGRPPAGQAALSREAILEAAMTLIDEEDVEELSMRTLARRLGVDPKSLYNHVANKDALLTGIAELILTQVRVPTPTGDLRTDLPALARAFRTATLGRHPRSARLLLTRPIEALADLGPLEAVLDLFLRAGATPEDAVHYLRIATAFLTGTLLREADSALTYALNDPAAAAERRVFLESSQLPSTRAVAEHLATCDHEQEFEFGITMLADALARRIGELTPTEDRPDTPR